ncbi:hypothetical protein VNO78_19119 [Psophocarpus tetragonolobus]|uniref:Uncharacterized protein n=1 Tax=Psophocarpus tetragonolobus TaxID=3891 RepID=A0AAN9S965_PSOTE
MLNSSENYASFFLLICYQWVETRVPKMNLLIDRGLCLALNGISMIRTSSDKAAEQEISSLFSEDGFQDHLLKYQIQMDCIVVLTDEVVVDENLDTFQKVEKLPLKINWIVFDTGVALQSSLLAVCGIEESQKQLIVVGS